MPSVNATHRKRLARALAAELAIPYLSALDRVTKAAVEGRLPQRLDDAGMQAAVRILVSAAETPSWRDYRPETEPATRHTAAGETIARRMAADPRDQQIYDMSARYEEATGRQGLLYISSPGSGKDRYVFGGEGGGYVCLGRDEAAAHIYGLLAALPQPPHPDTGTDTGATGTGTGTGSPSDGCQHLATEYRAQEGTYCTVCGDRLTSYREIAEADGFHLERSSLALLRMTWQGRVAWQVGSTRAPAPRFTIDDSPASDIKDLELRWLRDHDYLTTPPLAAGEEWAVARTTEFGDDVLAFHRADTDKFRDGLPDQKRTGPRVFTIRHSDVARCPISSLDARHYRNDGTCRCLPEPASAPAAADDTSRATTTAQQRKYVASIAHEGNPNPRCTVSSWRGGTGSRKGEGYGPGGYNRCVMEVGHASERHLDEWGTVFTLSAEGKFKQHGTVSQEEVALAATQAGMVVFDDGGVPPAGVDMVPRERPVLRIADLKPGMLVRANGHAVLKISTIYGEDRVSAQVVDPSPGSTAVRFYTADDVATWRVATVEARANPEQGQGPTG